MKWGDFELSLVSDGSLRLDGGAMFGVVPKPLWSKKHEPDDRNRITLGLNCLLVRSENGNILIDTGCGHKYSAKEIDIYGIEHTTTVVGELERLGLMPEDIDFVVNTHLHFDHCGGNTHLIGDEAIPTFPRATYFIRDREYRDATNPNERTKATYLPWNWEPLEHSGQLTLVEGDCEILPGVRLVGTPGHTLGHQSVLIRSSGKTFFYVADLCPTTAHIPLPWIMGYDVFPLTTLETRKNIYRQAVSEEWLLFFEHDSQTPAGYLERQDGRYTLQPRAWEVE